MHPEPDSLTWCRPLQQCVEQLLHLRAGLQFAPHRGRYMVHCHNLVHEDNDMMVQFGVGWKPGQPGPNDPILADPPKRDKLPDNWAQREVQDLRRRQSQRRRARRQRQRRRRLRERRERSTQTGAEAASRPAVCQRAKPRLLPVSSLLARALPRLATGGCWLRDAGRGQRRGKDLEAGTKQRADLRVTGRNGR
jgi:hypothetical protein